jgi:hypothetical protein
VEASTSRSIRFLDNELGAADADNPADLIRWLGNDSKLGDLIDRKHCGRRFEVDFCERDFPRFSSEYYCDERKTVFQKNLFKGPPGCSASGAR